MRNCDCLQRHLYDNVRPSYVFVRKVAPLHVAHYHVLNVDGVVLSHMGIPHQWKLNCCWLNHLNRLTEEDDSHMMNHQTLYYHSPDCSVSVLDSVGCIRSVRYSNYFEFCFDSFQLSNQQLGLRMDSMHFLAGSRWSLPKVVLYLADEVQIRWISTTPVTRQLDKVMKSTLNIQGQHSNPILFSLSL